MEDLMALVDVVRPARRGVLYDVLCVLGGSLLLAILSQVKVPLWFTPVPISLQTFGVMLIAASLGAKKGVGAILAYLFEGAIGLPVFAGGAAGLAVFAGPTMGYLLGFVVAVAIMGWMLEKNTSFTKGLLATVIGSLVMLVCGVIWLSIQFGFETALVIGFYPFLMGSLLKSIAAASLIRAGWKNLE